MADGLYDLVIERNVMVKMRDGVRLATDLYFPARDGQPVPGRFPAVFHRTPYDKSDVERNGNYGRFFAQRGYVAVYQDCRGTFQSEGDVNFLLPEAEDGYDTLQWIDQQPWSNGKVGSWGTSWSGWTQTAMAALGPTNLKAMVVNMSGADAHESSVRHGGALELRFLAWAFWHSAANTQRTLKADPTVDAALNLGAPAFADWLARMPLRKGQTQLKLVPPYQQWALDLLTKADYDEYWQHPSYAPALFWDDFPDVPILIIGGWYDSYTRSTCKNYGGLAARKQGPVRMLMGPWTHGTQTLEQSFAGDVEFGEDAALDDFRNLHLRYFDWALKGVDNGEANAPPVRIFAMGGGGRLSHQQRPAFPRRVLARRGRVATSPDELHQVLSARQRHLVAARASRRRWQYSLSLRSSQPGALHRRQCLLAFRDRPAAAGRGHFRQCAVAGADGATNGAGRVRSGGGTGVLRL